MGKWSDVDWMNNAIEELMATINLPFAGGLAQGGVSGVTPQGSAMGVAGLQHHNHMHGVQQYAQNHVIPDWLVGDQQLIEMLSMRMRWRQFGLPSPTLDNYKARFDRLMVCSVDNKVILVVCNSGQAPVVFEDEARMYPSDPLISQLRLLEK